MWEIKKQSLVKVLELLAMVPEKLGIPSSEYIWIRGSGNKIKLSLASYIAGEVELEGHGDWPIDSDFFLDRRVFLPFVYASKESKNKNMFKFERYKKQLKVSHGSRKVHYDSQTKVKGYGNLKIILKDKHSLLPVSEDLKAMLMCGKNCATSDSVLPHLNCVYVTKSSGGGLGVEAYAESAKVYYLGTGSLEKGKISTSIPFPLFLIGLLSVEGLQKLSWVGKYILLTFEDGKIWQPVSQEAIDSFPLRKIRRISKSGDNFNISFTASSRRFTKLMIRIGYYLQSVRRKDWVVTVKGKKGDDHVVATTNIPGAHFTEKVSVSATLKRDFTLDWALDILAPMFEFLAIKTKKVGIVVRTDEKHGSSYIRAGNYWLCTPSRQK